ncbi:MAG: deoxyribodipyrimidine photo-lyase [Burkholderiaceae bacterium]
MHYAQGLVWLRRDLRLTDNAALAVALSQCRRVYCAFIFDRAILDELRGTDLTWDRRVDFIHRSIVALDASLRKRGTALIVRHADAADAIVELAGELGIGAVFANADYEPYALQRDQRVKKALLQQGCDLLLFKDHVIFEKDELLTGSNTPFSVFTPYKNAWLKRVTASDLEARDSRAHAERLTPLPDAQQIPKLQQMGFTSTNLDDLPLPAGESGAQQMFDDFKSRIDRYEEARHFPAVRGPSYLSVHLRFGTISTRQLARFAYERRDSNGASVWLSELIWRDFYQMILWYHPHVVDHAYRLEYDRIEWETGPGADRMFAAWREGRTGYPMIDAAMAQINSSGYMHNRLRMVTASFLTKDLGIDWRRGERYFARQLNDYDLAANNGGWQWAASTGCDAQPYFRIFNPLTQSEKFDPEGRFIRCYVPQLANFIAKEIHVPWLVSVERQKEAGCIIGRDYAKPIVDHAEARKKTLERFSAVRRSGL